MTSSPTERTAREAYLQLPARDKMLVQSWRALGNSWFDSVVSSGVLTPHRRIRPDEAALIAAREHIDQLFVAEAERRNLTGAERARKESAQHEAAHAVVAQSFGLKVKLAAIRSDNGGTCMYEPAKSAFQTAAIALAGLCWIKAFCSNEFLGLANGCEADERMAVSALRGDAFELNRAWNYAWRTLKDNKEIVRAVAKRIEKDGHYLP